jgi:hypothetical protein
MRNSAPLVLGLSALGLGLAVSSADAGITSRVTNFLFTCDGTNKTINITATGFAANSTQGVLGAEITLFENRGGLQYVLLRAQGDPQKQVTSLGKDDSRSQVVFSGQGFVGFPPAFAASATIPATANAAGNIPFTIDGACNGGFGQVQGNVTIWFLVTP